MKTHANKAVVYEGVVAHARFKPVRHRLTYKVFSFLLDLDELDEAAASLRFFSRNRFNLFSLYDRDHGAGRSGGLAAHVRETLAEAGLDGSGRILMLAYPRMLGYAFNPLTVYYCHDCSGALAAILYEVRNTFGGRHSYLIPVEDTGETIGQAAGKVFHVSPFIDMDMRYRFTLSRPSDRVSVFIQTSDADGPVLNASFTGKAAPVTDRKLLALFFRYPLMTFKVIAGIHWEALRLLLKGLRLRPGAPAPARGVTVVPASEKHPRKVA